MPLEGHLALFLPLETTHFVRDFWEKRVPQSTLQKAFGGNSPLDGFFGELPGFDERYFHPFKRLGIVGCRMP